MPGSLRSCGNKAILQGKTYSCAMKFVGFLQNGIAPKEPAFIFMIDVSYNALSNGMLPILCQNLEKVLRNLPRETGQLESSIRVGLATFDQAVHFFDISSAAPKMLVMCK